MLNKVQFIGRLTKDPQTAGNQDNPVTTFKIAVNRPYTNQQNEREADFILIKAFKNKNLAQNCANYLQKGSLVYVEAKVKTGSFQDRNDNNKTVYTTDFIAEDVKFLSPTNGNGNGNGNQNNNNQNNNNRSNNNQNNNFNNNQNKNNFNDDPFAGDYGNQYDGPDPFSNGDFGNY
ncbi:hypothetical protein AWM68_17315 [Fictibacillus phosphorivorans]|uniref:Single-stranded DNA-binding protein n=1 Tax=Fictibacillus phosphorivorans TaxID=1221500 RepID=A0A165NW85_9BACL|nr:single-stranded DNA-binding protein [Fictibacillus phosphorivorans]KZE67933.1 hypothetical protein AWM68_17315 [Fictibacillus phosphorivorans]